MDDDELRYAAAEQILVASAICSLFLGIGAALHELAIWLPLLLLGTASLLGAGVLHPDRPLARRWASLTSGASVAAWCGLLLVAGRGEPVLLGIALLGVVGSGWAARFLHGGHRSVVGSSDAATAGVPEDRYARGVIEELPTSTTPR
jgi:hypothetical protein